MATTYAQMVAEAMAAVPAIAPGRAYERLQAHPHVLVVDVRDADGIHTTGLIPRAANISLGMLPLRADQEVPADLRDARLQDRMRPVMTTCETGHHAALGARLLREMGFVNVCFIEGGMRAWVHAGLPTVAGMSN